MSAGTTMVFVDGKTTYNFAANAVNWLRIPYTGTLSPREVNNDIAIKFNVKSIATGYLILWARFRQGDTTSSIMAAMQANGNIVIYAGNETIQTTGTVSFNADHELKTTRRGNIYTTYLDGVQINQSTLPAGGTPAYDWTFGTYFDFGTNPITANYAYPANWALLGISIKKV